jgi:ankyrin repeat protein
VPRVLQHHIYLKKNVLKLTDNATKFAVSGLQADQLKKYLPAGEKISEFVYDEKENSHSFKTVADFSKPRLCAEKQTKESHHKVGQKMKPNKVRYIILGEKTAERDFRELKALFQNVHWIHMEDGSFLWRDSNCNIDIIRRYIDETKCKSYEMEEIMAHNDRTMLLVAEPGMGKSTFLSYMAHEIKKCDSSVWVLRINLHEYTRELENIKLEQECIDKCKMFLWSAAHLPEQDALPLIGKIFQQALEQTKKLVILLDGFDEISPNYSSKVERLIREIRDNTSSTIWVSSRFSYRQKLEDIVTKLAVTLQPFKPDNQIQFLEQYWNEVIKISKRRNLQIFAEKLRILCSQNFSDKDGEFTGIPLQMKMLGEAFVKEAEEYCLSGKVNLPERFNLLYLFRKFTEKKCDIYFSEKNAMDVSKPEVKNDKESYLEKHMIAALISLFSLSEVNGLLEAINASDLEQTNKFLLSGRVQNLGIITQTSDGKPHFIHRCFAEYFAAKWFADNFTKCEDFISDMLFNSTYEVTRNIFDRMLAEDSEIHSAILSNDISALDEFLKKETDINISDKGGRTALHLATSYNSPYIQKLLSGSGVNANKLDGVLKWTPLRYADRTKSWMAMNILLQNGANDDDIVLTRHNIESQEWGQRALWECALKGHTKLLEFMLSCGTYVNAVIKVPENILPKSTLLHIASFCGQVEVVRLLLDRSADTNMRNANNDTALHCAAHLDNVAIIKLLLAKGISVNATNTQQNTPLHIAAVRGNLEATIVLVERGAALNSVNVNGYTPLMLAAYSGKLEVIRCLTETGPNFNIDKALLVAVERGHFDVIDFLLAKGADIDGSHEALDISPLMLATLRQNLPLVMHLVQKGADVNPSTADGTSKSALCAAVSMGNLKITEYLLMEDADLNARDINSMTPLAIAVFCNNTELAFYLMEKGADVNVPDAEKRTPLHHAVWNNNLKCTKRLVQAGANINYQGPRSTTALSMAVELDRIHIINVLVENNANTNIRDDLGNTALHVAVGKGNLWLVHYLIARGADVNIPNKERNTPLQWIFAMNWNEMAHNLLYARLPKEFPPLNIIIGGFVEISFEPRGLGF